MVCNILSELFGSMIACKTVRVVAVRQEKHLDVHLLLQQHVGSSQGSMHTRLITIIEQYDIIGKAVQESDLMDAECRTRIGHHIFDATLVHGNHIGIAFHHKHAVFLGNRLLRLEKSVEFTFLVINLTVGRVDIFLAHTLGTAIEHTSAESHHLATHTKPGEDGTAGESVEILSRFIIRGDEHTRLDQILRIITLFHSRLAESSTTVERKAELEFSDDVISETAASEILHTDGTTVHIILKDILEILGSPLVDDEHRFPFALPLLFLVGQFAFLDFDMIFLGKPAQGIGIGHLFQFHEEVDGITTLATGETMTDATGR